MNSKQMRTEIRAMQQMHEELGDAYLDLCETSQVDPLPVIWTTYPPRLSGQTQAYVLYGYEEQTDRDGQMGVEVFAESRTELVHEVFLRVLSLRCVN